MLELRDVSKIVSGDTHIFETSLAFEPGTFNVLLGPTMSGKTSLLRLMAGLDSPSSGTIFSNGQDVTGVPVRKRKLAMVYQQFVNYPTLSVFENIAAPLRAGAVAHKEIDRRVRKAAEMLEISDYLDRRPLSLSGGQQQRVALARSIVKDAELVLLDEPLANLDFKLREALREQLPTLFADSKSTVVYTTTDPAEALRLGRPTATLTEGRITQFGNAHDVFDRPDNLAAAEVLSDPPLNTMAAIKHGSELSLRHGLKLPTTAGLPDGPCILAVRPHHLTRQPKSTNCVRIPMCVRDHEITGNEMFIHLDFGGADWVMHARGVEEIEIGTELETFVNLDRLLLFSADGATRLGTTR